MKIKSQYFQKQRSLSNLVVKFADGMDNGFPGGWQLYPGVAMALLICMKMAGELPVAIVLSL